MDTHLTPSMIEIEITLDSHACSGRASRVSCRVYSLADGSDLSRAQLNSALSFANGAWIDLAKALAKARITRKCALSDLQPAQYKVNEAYRMRIEIGYLERQINLAIVARPDVDIDVCKNELDPVFRSTGFAPTFKPWPAIIPYACYERL